MRRVLAVVLALALVGAGAADAQRQQRQQRKPFLGAPAFVAQPGVIGALNGDKLDLNVRFVTALPTSINRVTLVGIIQFPPFQDEDDDGANENSPAFVYGPVVNVVNTRQVSFDIDGLFAYGPTGSVPRESDYTHKFLLEGDLSIKVGQMMNMQAGSRWRNLNLYTFFAYVLTGLEAPAGAEIEAEDRSVLLLGVSLPLAP